MAKDGIRVHIYGDYDDKDIRKLQRDLEQLKKDSDSTSEKFSKFGEGMSAVGRKMTLGLTLPIVGIGAASVALAANFETSMNMLQQNTQASAADMEKMSALAKKMGADTVFSAGDAADAMLELSKAGMTPAQISGGALQATMALAATEGLGLADSAVIASNAMATFGIKADKANTVADALAGGANASSASVSSLSQALSQVGPGATNAGLSLQETVGVLSAFDQAGIKGSDSGTSLKTMLTRLVPSTDAAASAMKKYNLDFVDAHGNFVSITNVAEQLKTRLGGLSEAQRTSALNTIFGSDATRAATVLMKDGAAGLQTYIDATNKQGGAADMANARMKGTAGALEAMKGSLETAGIAIGEALAPSVNKVAGFMAELTNKFTALPAGTQSTVVAVGAVVAALGPLMWVGGKVISSVKDVAGAISSTAKIAMSAVGGIQNFATGLTNASAAGSAFATPMMKFGGFVSSAASSVASFTVEIVKNGAAMAVSAGQWIANTAAMIASRVATMAGAVATGIMTAAQWALNLAMTMNPIGLIVVAIAAFIGAIVLAYTKIDWFRNMVDVAFKAIGTAISFVFNWVRDNWPTLLAILTGPIGIAVKLIIDHWDTIKNAAATVFNAVKNAIGGFVDTMKALPAMVGSVIGNVVKFYMDLPGKILGVLKGAGGWLVNVGRDMIQGLLDGAGNLLSKIGSFFLDKLPGWIVGPFKMALGIESPSKVFKGFGGHIADGLIEGIASKKDAVSAAAKDMAKAVVDKAKGIVDEWDTKLTDLKKVLDDKTKEVTDWAGNMRQALMSGFDIGSAYDAALDDQGKLNAGKWIDGVNSQVAQMDWFGNVLKTIQATGGPNAQALADYLASKGAEQGGAMGQALIDEGLVQTMADKLVTVTNAADATAKSMVPPFMTQGVASAQAMYDGFKKNFGEGGPARIAMENLMDRLSKAMDRTATITVRTVYEAAGVNLPGRAMGGPVAASTAYLVGEQGPEVFVPNAAGSIIPNYDLTSAMTGSSSVATSAAGGVSGGSSYNITVNTGVGDPRAIGQQIVELIKKYERASGPAFVAA
ncbi:Phage tail tape measure protein [uncultured Caudovirales phage]|uniref:Phage tail tape measure protein n=1 Tax=uncultured Caudovirales phage TaxID=2100421 RepID=A0A6J7WI13_9CAUD|nr:Phage tail tape measure protein [uncultured Caudovirales phage]